MGKHVEHILIKNFKSIKQIQLNGLKRINVFFGGPNSGKSNMLEALAVFSLPFLKENPSKKITQLIRMENIAELFYEGNMNYPARIETNIGIACFRHNKKGEIILEIRCVNGEGTYPIDDHLNFRFGRNKSYLPEIRKYSFPIKTTFGNAQPSYLIPPFGMNLLEILESYPVFKDEVSVLLEEHELIPVMDKETHSLKLMVAQRSGSDIFLLPYDSVSETLRRTIFFKAAIASNQDSVILLEEPDTSVFPSYIPTIVQEMIFKKDNQYIFTAQNPDLVEYLLEECPRELAVFLFTYQNYRTEIKRLSEEEIRRVLG